MSSSPISEPSGIPTEAELQDPAFAPGRAATHKFAVLYQGEHETLWDGTTVAVRRHARALASTGVPVLLKSFSNAVVTKAGTVEPVWAAGLPPEVMREVGELKRTSASVLVPLIKHMVVPSAEQLRRALVPRGALIAKGDDATWVMETRMKLLRSTIAFTVWERDRIDDEIARQLNACGECWVTCQDNAKTLEVSGVDREHVRIVPHPYDPASDVCKLTGRNPDRHGGWKLLYSIGRWEPRKAYDKLIEAFMVAFTPEDKAVLTLKISRLNWPDYPQPMEVIKALLERDDVRARGWTAETLDGRLFVTDERLSESKIVELHYRNNVYVSSSHGEAWCLPAYDGKCAGNAMVYVPYGGARDFADERDVAVAPLIGDMEPVPSSYRWEPDAQWAAVRVGTLADALRKVRLPERFERPSDWSERFSLQAVAQAMLEGVLKVAQVHPEALKYLRGCIGR